MPIQVRSRIGERGKLESGEWRHALENYAQSLQDLYERLATRGEVTMERLRRQPRGEETANHTQPPEVPSEA